MIFSPNISSNPNASIMKKTTKTNFGFRASALLFSLAAAGVVHAEPAVILNDDMSSPNYNAWSYNNSSSGLNPDDSSFIDGGSAQASGGNPDGYFAIEHTLSLNDGAVKTQVSLQSIFEGLGPAYTPTVSGAIQSLSFSIDLRSSGPASSVGLVVSDSNGGQITGYTSFTPDGTWQTITVSGLNQGDLGDRNLSGSNPLSFGFSFLAYGFLTDDGNGGHTPESFTLDVDNFIVTAIPVPEPSSLVLFGIMGLGLIARRSRG